MICNLLLIVFLSIYNNEGTVIGLYTDFEPITTVGTTCMTSNITIVTALLCLVIGPNCKCGQLDEVCGNNELEHDEYLGKLFNITAKSQLLRGVSQ